MSQSQQTARPIGRLQAQRDPLADCDDDQVLRCDDPTTGWRWFYEVRGDGRVERYHEYHGYGREIVPREHASETARLERVESVAVSRVHLAVARGDV
ncbi:hypothetical protein Htur_5054 (plasmid) [Haloterrigena turkmenica DSM 5511]|uniref:Uncharacterized protein n=1 Tax=Haloterrigena turkmenica (strain ATCC 51198 / DSM 5511 / JCM 9101 / NCIMB 13204 / VKM B-1734 / 4k) TaxID=543526 RepID=D2S3J4_HALTV|nr:hypothetical protein [Haloterrigena turkmenica]ADB63941.1 hypothetical protein Htur_5054 [Haloterrigena turkmenica DSM 5511]